MGRVNQAPIRLAPDAEEWVHAWVQEQLQKGLIRLAGQYEDLPMITSLLLVPGQQ